MYCKTIMKISALSSDKIDQYEYLTGDKILPSDQNRIEQAKFTYSPVNKAFEKSKEKKEIKEIKEKNI